MTLAGRRVLYISYNGMLDPLGQSQVIPYLRGLAGLGVRFTLLSYERSAALQANGKSKCDEVRESLAANGIEWHWLRYHQRPSLPATIYDVAAGIRYAEKLARRNGIEMVHARSHIPATIGLALRRRLATKLIFDLRGLMAEEYVDAQHWSTGGIPYRLTKTMERRILAQADAVVTLTEKIWPIVKNWKGLRNRAVAHEVVPCCVDLELYKFNQDDRRRRRDELGLRDRRVLIYSGSIGGWYLTDAMVDLFSELIKKRGDWHFLWLTNGPADLIKKLMEARGINARQYTIRSVASTEVASYLSAGDAGVAFYKPGLSRLATSPVKVSEYLACGLPVIINGGIGDSEELVLREEAGALINNFNGIEYAKAANIVEEFAAHADRTRDLTRKVAERWFDLRRVGTERYSRLYERVLTSSN
jgi:glycosyltransferase involved in cell wall biosynthesis